MNDPHVAALIYRIEHGDSIDYSQAKPLVVDGPQFRLSVEDMRARFELKAHYSTAEQARDAVADYIRVWEFDATLKRGTRIRSDCGSTRLKSSIEIRLRERSDSVAVSLVWAEPYRQS